MRQEEGPYPTSCRMSNYNRREAPDKEINHMKYLKMLGLAAVAAMALMAFVGASAASATVLYSGATKLGSGTTISAKSIGTATLATTEGTVLDECTGSTLHGSTSTAGSSTTTVKGPISSLNWGTCTKPTTTIKNGELEIHHIAGTHNGTLTVKGTQVTISTIFGSCVYTASDIGTLVGGNPAKISIVKQNVSLVSGFCPSHAVWTAEFEVTAPKPLWVGLS